ncbi:MAG: endonuclease III [Methanomicrobiales archaeon]|nr:endonuclease III [Methanomicrobiales archaeon]
MKILRRTYPGASWGKRKGRTTDPFQILILTILSAQTTDNAVDRVKERLFSEFPDPASLAAAQIGSIEEIVHSLGFFRAKARHIREAASMLQERFRGEVPSRMEELLQLPGVGRKTANIVLHHAFGRCEGIAVDTHVKRLAGRIGLSDSSSQSGIERDLMKLVPRRLWGDITDLLIAHGRRICTARQPRCPECPIAHLCRYYLDASDKVRSEE